VTEYVWSDMRDPFIERVGSAPSAATEERILDVFSGHPMLVAAGMAHVGERYDSGLIHSPWPVLAKHVEEAVAAIGRGDVSASGGQDRTKALQRGRQWMRAAGMHYDRESEVEDELFGYSGMLRTYAGDAELRAELLAYWHEQRPRGEQVEQEAEARARAHVAARKRAAEPHTPEPRVPVASGNPFIEDA